MIYLYDTAGDRCSACEGMYGLRCLERPTVTPAFGIHLCAIHAPGWNAHDAAKKRRILNAAIDGLLDQDITLDEIANEVVRRRTPTMPDGVLLANENFRDLLRSKRRTHV